MAFRVTVHYWRGVRRTPDVLWVMPHLEDNGKGLRVFLAAGPAGQVFGPHVVDGVDQRAKPPGVAMLVVLDRNAYGQQVFGVPDHTMN
jgi:hypothetical protein